MFDRIIALLTAPATEFTEMPEADARHALGALLVRVAKADGTYLFQEIEEIDLLLADLYALNPVEAARMRAECERLERAMPDTSELVHILACDVTSAQRDELVRALWKVAKTDGLSDDAEQQVIRVATQTFGMSPETAAELRA